MAKKDYKSPKMIEVKVNVEQDLLSASAGSGGCGSNVACPSDGCPEDV